MKILVVNAGSSSLKCSIYDEENLDKAGEIHAERIADHDSHFLIFHNDEEEETIAEIADHEFALKEIVRLMTEKGMIKSEQEIGAVVNRVVHGGEYFSDAIIVNEAVKKSINICSDIAPLHNPINLHSIELSEKLFPHAKHIAVFDTSFHQTIPVKNYLFALPKKYTKKYGIRKYGFHGISHQYVSQKLEEVLGKMPEKVISCHIGNGASIAAIEEGKCINTSMGFTPVDGLVMGTRVGNIDPGAILFLQEKEGWTPAETTSVLNRQSGILGLTGKTGDIEDLEDGISLGNADYEMALEIYVSRIVRCIASYIADLSGVDCIVLTAGVMENSSNIRKMIAKKLEFAGVEFDDFQNLFRGEIRTISTRYSPVRLIVIPTDEEWMMAKEAKKFID